MKWCAEARVARQLGLSEFVDLLRWVEGTGDAALIPRNGWSCYGVRETIREVVERHGSPSSVGDLKDRMGSPGLARFPLTTVLLTSSVLDLGPVVTGLDPLLS